ncbi:transposase [Micromonospora sp. NPDC048839]|uniref:transposase n=1 Tax=Micromonospora sp. NPDC048839 TaxID=3155641 RepID=UPI0033F86D59
MSPAFHLIVDRHPVRRRISVRDWPAENGASIEMHMLPGYAPELDPVELLNGDVERRVAQANPGNVTELTAAATARLRRRQNQPDIVKALFRRPEVRYAAA